MAEILQISFSNTLFWKVAFIFGFKYVSYIPADNNETLFQLIAQYSTGDWPLPLPMIAHTYDAKGPFYYHVITSVVKCGMKLLIHRLSWQMDK